MTEFLDKLMKNYTSLFPDKKITFSFDEKCHRKFEIMFDKGSTNPYHHVEHDHVRVNIEGRDPIYVEIMPHRMNYLWADIKTMINGKPEPILPNQ